MPFTSEFKKIGAEGKEIRREVRERTLGYILTAFGLVAGLAWNEAVSELIGYFINVEKNTVIAKFIYAIVITLLVVIASVYLTRFLKRQEQADHTEERKQ
ncbi:hypothetical protein C4552_03665 [Candidatus Parcubacteria bacterium]|nr:MAG: hypothetical protein C4552_03665 [Candidatus Parcubacteria bacterium]